jgi:hypothetical protein
MKTVFTIVLGVIISLNVTMAQDTKSKWNALLNKQKLAQYFDGIFNQLGIKVEETGEKFTVVHHGDHFDLQDGVNKDSVDYYVTLSLQNIKNMQGHGADSQIDSGESYKIMSVLFTPLTRASLKAPLLNRPLVRSFSGIEDHIHVHLISDKNDTTTHTLLFMNKNWMVVPGQHGEAKRTFHLSPEEAINYQRKMFQALQDDNMKSWRKFRKWYLKWRPDVSEKN